MAQDEFSTFLENRDLTPGQCNAFGAQLLELASTLGLDPRGLGKLVVFTSQIIDAARPLASRQEASSRDKIIGTLTQHPQVYHMVDYWSRREGSPGHGIKHRRGQAISPGVEKGLDRPAVLAKALDGLNLFGESWHGGEGIVGRVSIDQYTAFILTFRSKNPEEQSRPTVRLYTALPSIEEFQETIEGLNADPTILLEAFPLVCPQPANLSHDIHLVTPYVIDLNEAWKTTR